MSNREWKQVEVERNIVVPFEWRDPTPGGQNLGRAEFQICLKFKRGQTSEFWVYPIQTHLDTCWHWVGVYDDFSISSYQGLEKTGAWMLRWCEEHKTLSFNVYSPPDAKVLVIDCHGLEFWRSYP